MQGRIKMYFYDVTIRVLKDGKPFETQMIKGTLEKSDHLARRQILDILLKSGYHVVSMESHKLKKSV